MRRTFAMAGGLVGLLVTGTLAASSQVGSGPATHGPPVAPLPLALPDPGVAVALARTAEGTLLLNAVTEDAVIGVLLAGTPLDAHATHGLAGLRQLRDAGPDHRVPLDALLPPVPSPFPHIGSGNNFATHQEEVGVHDEPALFPKMSTPTAWNADVPAARRLDYEAELCAVTLDDVAPGDAAPLGFLLCNDFTDRWSMMRGIKPGTPLGTTGFPDGKGGPGRLATGPWLVIPDNAHHFVASVQLRLAVDGRLRQDAPQSLAIWNHPRIIDQAFAACALDYRYHGEPVAWPACDRIPAGTLILGGTPGGVVFRPWNVWAWWMYLQPDAVVVTEGTGLGRLRNRVRG